MSQQVKKKLSAAEKFAVRVAKNPAAMSKYSNDPEIMEVLQDIQGLL